MFYKYDFQFSIKHVKLKFLKTETELYAVPSVDTFTDIVIGERLLYT